jgi:hypothetical protein
MTNRKIAYWVMPPEADAECVAHMEEVLATYEKPYNPHVPVLLYGRTAWAVTARNVLAHCCHGATRQAG